MGHPRSVRWPSGSCRRGTLFSELCIIGGGGGATVQYFTDALYGTLNSYQMAQFIHIDVIRIFLDACQNAR